MSRAFTLIETLIVTVLIAIVVGIAIQSSRSFLKTERENQIVRGIESLEKAKFYCETVGKLDSLKFIGYIEAGSVQDEQERVKGKYVLTSVVLQLNNSMYYAYVDDDENDETPAVWSEITESSEEERWQAIKPWAQWPSGVIEPLDLFRGTSVTSVRIGVFGESVSVQRSGD